MPLCPLFGGRLLFRIQDHEVLVHYRLFYNEVVRYWECPLMEAPLYHLDDHISLQLLGKLQLPQKRCPEGSNDLGPGRLRSPVVPSAQNLPQALLHVAGVCFDDVQFVRTQAQLDPNGIPTGSLTQEIRDSEEVKEAHCRETIATIQERVITKLSKRNSIMCYSYTHKIT